MDLKTSLRNFRRRYREPAIKFLFKLIRLLPPSLAFRLGSGIGWMLWLSNGTSRKVTEVNLRICFPDKDEREIEQIAKGSLRNLGYAMTELPLLWTSTERQILDRVVRVEGIEYFENVIRAGKGVICLTPHLGAWEAMGLYMSIKHPMTTMYRPPRMSSLEEIMLKGRARFGVKLAPTDVRGVRVLLSALKKGEFLGILPDQDPGKVGGEFAPFFGVEANTMTLVSRLAQKTGAASIICFAERLPKAEGYVIHFQPGLDNIGDKDTTTSLTALNKGIENFVRQYPAQYQWSYKRFKTRPDGDDKIY